MKSKSFPTQLVIIFFILSVIVIFFICFFSYKSIETHYSKFASKQLGRTGLVLISRLQDSIDINNHTKVESWLKFVSKDFDERVTIISKEGIVIADTQTDPSKMQNQLYMPEFLQAKEKNIGFSHRFSKSVDSKMIYCALPIKSSDTIVGFLRVGIYSYTLDSELSELKIKLIYVTLLVLVVSLIFVYLVFSISFKPMRNLIKSIRLVLDDKKSELDQKFPDNEIGELAKLCNKMIEKVNHNNSDLREMKEIIKKVLASLNMPMWIIDVNGKFVHVNDSFQLLVNSSIIPGTHYAEIVRSKKLFFLIKNILEGKKPPKPIEIEINNRTYLASYTKVNISDEYIFLLNDITELKEVQQDKVEFIFNVSNELGTPLSSIENLIESLEIEEGEDNQQYLNIIKRNIESLTKIVNEASSFSHLEKSDDLEIVTIHLKPLILNAYIIFKSKAEERDLKLKIDVDSKLKINADPFKLEQIIFKLIENAIIYSDFGTITISAKESGEFIELSVKDEGIGILEHDKEKIFESFYMVDKSRTRNPDSIGLGLTIVKRIVELHKGSVEVQSIIDEGSNFIIRLPKAESTKNEKIETKKKEDVE